MGIIFVTSLLALGMNLVYKAGYLKGSLQNNNKLFKENQDLEKKIRVMLEKWNVLLNKKNNLVMENEDLKSSLYKISSIEFPINAGLLDDAKRRKIYRDYINSVTKVHWVEPLKESTSGMNIILNRQN
jgi:hypothetical protein